MSNFISLYKDLGIARPTIIKIIDRFVDEVGNEDERMEDVMDSLSLLNQRADKYTPEEARKLISWYITIHDECVSDNSDDFSGVEVYNAKQKIKRFDNAMSVIELNLMNL